MAVSLLQTPSTTKVTPAYNENWFIASSSQSSQPNFKFTVKITDVATSTQWTEQIEPVYGTNRIYFDAAAYAEKYMVNFFDDNSSGWKKCVDAYRKITVNIGETYGSTPTYASGTDLTYNVWNAGLDTQTFAYYNADDYLYNNTTSNFKFLTTVGGLKVYEDRSNYLYFLGTVGNTADLPYIDVNTYNAGGGFIGTSTIARPSYTTGLIGDQYQCIDIGVKGLTSIASGLVTGTYPIITSSVASYEISIAASPRPIKFGLNTITCNPKYTVYSLHYLNQKGGYDTLHCSKVSEKTSTKSATTFKQNPWYEIFTFPTSVMAYNPSMMLEKTQGITITDSLKLNSDWLTQEEFDRHRDLFASTDIRLDLGSSTPNIAVKITNGNYIQKNNDRLRMLSFDLSYTFNNHRQRG
jgi:hypothetical protein